jgi:hypothetical protein
MTVRRPAIAVAVVLLSFLGSGHVGTLRRISDGHTLLALLVES